MKNPCYDMNTQSDCPDRHVGCAVNCTKWNEYIKLREDEYARRKKVSQATGDYSEHVKESCRRFSQNRRTYKIGGEQ